ncbi:MAG: hypothetical protein K2K54_00015 [Lachnospiraceae bacterium]|nr:hypothetical protein [Lachnospiraceae bacterium]
MKKIRFISGCFVVGMILLIMIAAVASSGERGEKQEFEMVRQEVNEQIKRNMEKAAEEGNFSNYLEPSEVSFVVKNVCKEDVLKYVVKVIFIAKTDRELSDIEMKEAAGDIAGLFQEFKTVWGKRVTTDSQRGNGGIVSVINGKVIDQKGANGKKVKVGEQKRIVIRRRGCERVITL